MSRYLSGLCTRVILLASTLGSSHVRQSNPSTSIFLGWAFRTKRIRARKLDQVCPFPTGKKKKEPTQVRSGCRSWDYYRKTYHREYFIRCANGRYTLCGFCCTHLHSRTTRRKSGGGGKHDLNGHKSMHKHSVSQTRNCCRYPEKNTIHHASCANRHAGILVLIKKYVMARNIISLVPYMYIRTIITFLSKMVYNRIQ